MKNMRTPTKHVEAQKIKKITIIVGREPILLSLLSTFHDSGFGILRKRLKSNFSKRGHVVSFESKIMLS